jgi:hypothetical protein
MVFGDSEMERGGEMRRGEGDVAAIGNHQPQCLEPKMSKLSWEKCLHPESIKVLTDLTK